jgi:hypothetical protein
MTEEKIVELENRRSFVAPDGETEYFIATPNAEDIRNADWQYSKQYTKCLNEGLPTSAELTDILKRRGVIGQDFENRAEELSNVLNDCIMKLAVATTNEEKTTLANEVARAREALFQWNQRLSGPMSNTCEQISDDTRLEYLTSCIIQSKDGNRVWPTYEDFLSSKDQTLTLKSRYEVMLFLQGYDSDFLDNTPEAMAIKEVQTNLLEEAEKEQKILDELAAAAAAKEKAVDEEKPKKSTGSTTRKTSTTVKKESKEN